MIDCYGQVVFLLPWLRRTLNPPWTAVGPLEPLLVPYPLLKLKNFLRINADKDTLTVPELQHMQPLTISHFHLPQWGRYGGWFSFHYFMVGWATRPPQLSRSLSRATLVWWSMETDIPSSRAYIRETMYGNTAVTTVVLKYAIIGDVIRTGI